ncbi:hypothetical protein AG1IA_05245 [Rhizoctonia solani AG-1 IA]|uniref:Uncharacterized protein n=1 Tax=Thanatephorus cucumeris (strain AG1-IA) TaxID=983506 RepID=L8WRI8_THACA|nr:hypothetical protein AG1IA_05245 [Rhizoctonia solani AG-1 IA]
MGRHVDNTTLAAYNHLSKLCSAKRAVDPNLYKTLSLKPYETVMPQMLSLRLFAAAEWKYCHCVDLYRPGWRYHTSSGVSSFGRMWQSKCSHTHRSTVAPAPAVPTVTTPVATQPPTTQNVAPTTTPRVVGQPAPTLASPEPTIYTYTTVDASGNTQTFVDTYTPTYDVTTVPFSAPAGTILPYGEYTSMYGGSGTGNQLNSAGRLWAGASALIGAVTGLALVF